MGDRELPEDALALGRDLDQDFPVVEGAPVSPDHAEGGKPVDELDDRMVFELKLPGQGSDRGKTVGGKTFDREQELVLLGLEPGIPGGLLAEGEKAADQMAKMRQVLEIWLA